jgi:hypothetical protein
VIGRVYFENRRFEFVAKELLMLLGVIRYVVTIMVLSACLSGCSKSVDPSRKETSPVKGEVTVDGKAAALVRIELHDVKGFDTKSPTIPHGITDDQGKFEILTYDLADGAPEGEYTATFTWQELKIMGQEMESPDKLKGKYATPEKSTIKVKVEKGKPTDMGKIELKTK